jgi:predicted phage tail protein
MATTVRVNPRFTVCYEGRAYGPGETVEVSDDAAAGWTAWGSVTPVGKEPHEADKAKPARRT